MAPFDRVDKFAWKKARLRSVAAVVSGAWCDPAGQQGGPWRMGRGGIPSRDAVGAGGARSLCGFDGGAGGGAAREGWAVAAGPVQLRLLADNIADAEVFCRVAAVVGRDPVWAAVCCRRGGAELVWPGPYYGVRAADPGLLRSNLHLLSRTAGQRQHHERQCGVHPVRSGAGVHSARTAIGEVGMVLR